MYHDTQGKQFEQMTYLFQISIYYNTCHYYVIGNKKNVDQLSLFFNVLANLAKFVPPVNE